MKPAKLPGQDATQLELHVSIIEANARIAELEAAIRAILAINDEAPLQDDTGEDIYQSMELSKALDTAECLVGWKQ